ncbi:hypothetical protein DET47_1291 [Shewanella putrefaciens]|nr:hypothetical protein DET47_1291 [Shewanella putrefaciens]
MNQSEDFGKILKLWPNLVDHYTAHDDAVKIEQTIILKYFIFMQFSSFYFGKIWRDDSFLIFLNSDIEQ